LSEVYRSVISITISLAILLMLTSMVFTLTVYINSRSSQVLLNIIESRLIELFTYCASEENITVKLSLNDIVQKPFELYVVNSNTLLAQIPLKFFPNVKFSKEIVLPRYILIDYRGLLPRDFTLIFRKVVNGSIVVRVKT